MGYVINVMLSFDSEELCEQGEDKPRESCAPLQRINAWLKRYGELVSLVGPTYEDGVGDGINANLYGGGFRHLDIDQFVAVVGAQQWKRRSRVQLWIGGEDEPFSAIKLGRISAPGGARRKTAKRRPSSAKRGSTRQL